MLKASICVRGLIVVFVFLGSAIASRGEEARTPGSSQPPDTNQYQRPAIHYGFVCRPSKTPDGSCAIAPNAPTLGNPTLLKLIDVNASAPGSDSVGRTEPSIAVDPEHPNVIVVHGGFGDWAGPQCASIFVSTDSGTSWTRVRSINPPTNIPVTTGPNDTTLAYGANSLLTASFLTQVNPFSGNDIFTGSTTSPSKTARFNGT